MAIPAGVKREEHLYLLAGTPLEEYLEFRAKEFLDANPEDAEKAAEIWRTANDRFRQIQRKEPHWADQPKIVPLPAPFQTMVAQVEGNPIYQKAFQTVKVDIGLVELDRLVVRQNLINLEHVRRIKERIGQDITPESVFRICLPIDRTTPWHRVDTSAKNTIEFISESNDIRFLESVALRPEQVASYQTFGTVAGIAGVAVGYGSNFLNAIAAQNRLVLNNGSHRTFAFRVLGVTHVPCVIQKATNSDELQAVAVGALRRDPDRFLRQSRPTVLKDYFNTDLQMILSLAATVRHVRIQFTIETFDTPPL
jgi:hypothetical protein